MAKRGSMHDARKLRIHERAGGICWLCGEAVQALGPSVQYDHRNVHWISLDDSDANLFPMHTACHALKTNVGVQGQMSDKARVAKVKRLQKGNDPEREKKPSRLQVRGFQKGPKKAWPKRSFEKKRPPPGGR